MNGRLSGTNALNQTRLVVSAHLHQLKKPPQQLIVDTLSRILPDSTMTIEDIIEKYKALSPQEQLDVELFVKKLAVVRPMSPSQLGELASSLPDSEGQVLDSLKEKIIAGFYGDCQEHTSPSSTD